MPEHLQREHRERRGLALKETLHGPVHRGVWRHTESVSKGAVRLGPRDTQGHQRSPDRVLALQTAEGECEREGATSVRYARLGGVHLELREDGRSRASARERREGVDVRQQPLLEAPHGRPRLVLATMPELAEDRDVFHTIPREALDLRG